MKKKSILKKNGDEIMYHLINSLLAGALVLLGSFTSGILTEQSIITAVVTSLIIAVTKFYEYWKSEEKEYVGKRSKIFSFYGNV